MSETVTLAPLTSLTNDTSAIATINSNSQLIETAFADCLSLSGSSPNAMQNNLDMNNNQILNLPSPATINSPARLIDIVANPTLALTIPPVGTSGATVPLLNTNVTWSGTSTFGGPFVQADTYTGGSGNILATRGSTASPITDSKATAVFQSVNDTSTEEGVTLYASLIKHNTATIDHHCIYSECVDTVGGGSIAGGRFTSALLGGIGGNSSGATNVGLANVPYSFVLGAENQCWVVGTAQEASTTFSITSFATGVLSSCAGTKSADAGFLINPNGYTSGHAYITGFMVPTTGAGAGNDPVRDTAFRCDASCVNGLDFTRGTYSGSAIKCTGFTVSNTGVVVATTITGTTLTGSTIVSTGSVKSSSASAGVGYATGAGGVVTQITSKSTGVTLNKPTGQIVMQAANLAAGAEVVFTVTNSTVAASDVIIVNMSGGGTTGAYLFSVTAVGAGTFDITVSNATAGGLAEAVTLNFAVIKGVAS